MSISGMGNHWAHSSSAMSGASSRSMAPDQKMAMLFSKIDTSGIGSITADQFAQAFSTSHPPPVFKSAGADTIFSQLSKGSNTISKQDFIDGMKKMMEQFRTQALNATTTAPAGSFASSLNAINGLGSSTSSGFYTKV